MRRRPSTSASPRSAQCCASPGCAASSTGSSRCAATVARMLECAAEQDDPLRATRRSCGSRYDVALRRGEVLGLTVDDINLIGGALPPPGAGEGRDRAAPRRRAGEHKRGASPRGSASAALGKSGRSRRPRRRPGGDTARRSPASGSSSSIAAGLRASNKTVERSSSR